MAKQKVVDKLWREFERAQASFLTGDDEPAPATPERDDVAAYRAAALRDVYEGLSELAGIAPECEQDSEMCEVCLLMRVCSVLSVLEHCVGRLVMLAEVRRVLG